MNTSNAFKIILGSILMFSLLTACGTPETTHTAVPLQATEPTQKPSDTPLPSSTHTSVPPPTHTNTPTSIPANTPTPTKQLWSKKANMPTARYSLSTIVVNGKIYAIGGIGGLTIVEEFDPETDTWTRKADMPTGRSFLAANVVNDKIYVLGGNAGPNLWGTTLASVEIYDPATDTWTKGVDMPRPRDAFGTSVVNRKI
jgi:N-acetylneuraminic acid mutarotase